ncbi:MAG: DUF3570 domain-containing protein, partial [Gammaproteobacteria bacterium]|nr:DUF3570 domain-containing protein [Gammaproteobacteria bacterium]
MQLKSATSVRLALAAASCALLADPPAQAAQRGAWVVNAGTLMYEEKDRVSIIEPALMATYKFNDEDYIDVRVVNDTMTGASPVGASVSSHPQTLPPMLSTSASGSVSNGTYVAPEALPVNRFSDVRNSIAVNWQKAFSRTFRTVIGSSASVEGDYSSFGGSLTLLRDTADKLTTFTAGVSYSHDLINPVGGPPEPLTVLPLTLPEPEDHSTHGEEEHEASIIYKQKQLSDLMVGVTQVVSKHVLAQLNYSVGYTSGYLTDPYKIISRV